MTKVAPETPTIEVTPKIEAGGLHRGVRLPAGMTPECLDDLATLFNDFGDGLLVEDGEEISHVRAAVMAFEKVSRALRQTDGDVRDAVPSPRFRG